MNMKRLLAVALVTVGVGAGAQTTPSTPAKKELVAKLMQLQQPAFENVARGLAAQPAAAMVQQVNFIMQTRIPPDKREAIGKDIQGDLKKYEDEVLPLMRDRAVKLAPSTVGAMVEERFTEDELKQLIAIIESPVNRKFLQMSAELQKSLSEKLVAETRGAVEPKIKTLQAAIAGHLGIPPNAAPGVDGAQGTPAPAAARPPARPASK